MIIFKNMLSFALTAKAYGWFIVAGVEGTMIPISGVQVGVCLLTVPMCKCNYFPSLSCSSARAFMLYIADSRLKMSLGNA